MTDEGEMCLVRGSVKVLLSLIERDDTRLALYPWP